MKKKIKINNKSKVKNLDLNFIKTFTVKTKKKFENFVSDYQKKRHKDKIDNKKRNLNRKKTIKKREIAKIKRRKTPNFTTKKINYG